MSIIIIATPMSPPIRDHATPIYDFVTAPDVAFVHGLIVKGDNTRSRQIRKMPGFVYQSIAVLGGIWGKF